MVLARFDWDDGNAAKCQKHGVSVEEIEFVIRSGPFIQPDHKHSIDEARFIAIGPNPAGRLTFVVYTLRVSDEEEVVRPVSARFMHDKEIRRYVDQRRAEGSDNEN